MPESWADGFVVSPSAWQLGFLPAPPHGFVGCLEALGRTKWPAVSAASGYVPRGDACGRNI